MWSLNYTGLLCVKADKIQIQGELWDFGSKFYRAWRACWAITDRLVSVNIWHTRPGRMNNTPYKISDAQGNVLGSDENYKI